MDNLIDVKMLYCKTYGNVFNPEQPTLTLDTVKVFF